MGVAPDLLEAARPEPLPRKPRLVTTPQPAVAVDTPTWSELLPGGAHWARRLPPGSTLKLTAVEGSRGVSCLLYNATDTSERYNAADTVKIQFNVQLGTGKLLYSDMGRVLAAITADTCGRHDTLGGMSTAASNLAKYGPGHRNARDNFIQRLGRLGMSKRDLMPALTLFAGLEVEPDGRMLHVPGVAHPGDFISLRAELPLLVLLSNTPHACDPRSDYAPLPLQIEVFPTRALRPDDPCRHRCPEAERAYLNTSQYLDELHP